MNIPPTNISPTVLCETLKKIASQYNEGTEEHTSLKTAALAYTYLHSHSSLSEAFEKFKKCSQAKLTPKMKTTFANFGIDSSN